MIDANPFVTALLGYSHDELMGKELWEIGLFQDINENRAAYRGTAEKGYVRYEHLPLEEAEKRAQRSEDRVRQQRLCGKRAAGRSMQHP